ncbi:MarR family winged helix-turn-helix transcriptional regulator [Staphylococcus gallinarum]|uniref:MarR family winged helix-turn-helix transcriptional regulator n=1 Tax=Staphylococcus gallinarum TaxID=1293 RepID=UPI003171DF62
MIKDGKINDFLYLFYKTNKSITKVVNNILKDYEITFTNYLVLLSLDYDKETNVKSIADLLDLDTGTLSPITKRLEAKGLLIRNRSTLDERSIELRLSDKGKGLKNNFDKISSEIEGGLSMKIDELNEYLFILNNLKR